MLPHGQEVGVEARRKTVLIVDDEEPFLLSLVDALAPHAARFRVMTALSGPAAVALAERFHVDLLVTDLKMPGMNGFELLWRFAAYHPHVSVIVMTAFNSPEIGRALAGFSPVAVLEKPLDLDELAAVINEGLRKTERDERRKSAGFSVAALVLLTLTAAREVPPRPLDASTDGIASACMPLDTQSN